MQRHKQAALNISWFSLLTVLGGLLQANHSLQPNSIETSSNQSSHLTNQVRIEVRGEHRYIYANGIPNHAVGTFPNSGNPNTIAEQEHLYRVPLNPQLTGTITPVRPAFGVALNGIPFEPGTAEAWNRDRSSPWRYEALTGFIDLGMDENNAHVQPTGSYHYHGLPTGLLRHESGTTPGMAQAGMTQLGYAADGFPIYGPHGYSDPNDMASALTDMRSSYQLKAGPRPDSRPDGPGGAHDGTFTGDFEYVEGAGDLDECNGRFGVTPEYPEGTYHYYITESFPFIPRCVKGTPDESFTRRNEPQGGPPTDRRPRGYGNDSTPGGPPPRGPRPGGPPPQR